MHAQGRNVSLLGATAVVGCAYENSCSYCADVAVHACGWIRIRVKCMRVPLGGNGGEEGPSRLMTHAPTLPGVERRWCSCIGSSVCSSCVASYLLLLANHGSNLCLLPCGPTHVQGFACMWSSGDAAPAGTLCLDERPNLWHTVVQGEHIPKHPSTSWATCIDKKPCCCCNTVGLLGASASAH